MSMTTETRGDALIVTGLDRLSATNANWFKELTCSKLAETHRFVEVDLARVAFIDSDGLGALISVKKRLAARDGQLRLLRPQPPVEQLLRMLHLEQVFDLIQG